MRGCGPGKGERNLFAKERDGPGNREGVIMADEGVVQARDRGCSLQKRGGPGKLRGCGSGR